jgi:phenylalanyl-tRNA synthetase beta chain
LFEIGPQYAGANPEDQSQVAAGIRVGSSGPRHWSAPPRDFDLFDAKADALAVLETIGAPAGSAQISDDAPAWYHPGRSGTLRLGPHKVLAAFGEIHPGVLARMDVAGPVAAFEIFLDQVPPVRSGKGKARANLELSPYQVVERDFAFVVDAGVSADSVVRAAQGADKALIAGVEVFDLFIGPELGAGKKSLAIAVVLQPTDATLTDAAIDAVSGRIVAAVAKATGGKLRG